MIYLKRLTTGWSESRQILYAGRMYQVLALGWDYTPCGRGQGHVIRFFNLAFNHILGIGEARQFKFYVDIYTGVLTHALGLYTNRESDMLRVMWPLETLGSK